MRRVQPTAFLVAVCVAAALCSAANDELPDISATGACQAEIAAYCTGTAAKVRSRWCLHVRVLAACLLKI
jgi:hypothetical protein